METLFVPIEEAARAIGGSRSTVYRLIETGDLERVKIGRRALVTTESIREYVARLSAAAGA
ncbi:helix-turn-helix domain-containing protein [Brachybacterium muris]|uniref:Excisionase n=1 Tax=Brachybacterium muris UCD-AY4 TaxID=1249481 RepID=A0A022KXA5_9MICO|nr:helix-turn-helix domain-containing protein [Brachybacterium muris]EYT50516.1 excisionase [Brachybacterium muris UCD-AY4]